MEKASVQLGNSTLELSTGKLALLASGSVTVKLGETVVLATASISREPKPEVDFLPLLVDFEEKLYASGKISGSRFVKREGRATENAILTARLVDRAIRPLFPAGFYHDVQVVATVLSADLINDPDTIAVIGASVALLQSGAPFQGPVGAVKVGLIDGQFILYPTYEELTKSDLDLIVAGTPEKILMLEASGKEVPEKTLLEAIKFGHKALQATIKVQSDLLAKTKPNLQRYKITPLDPSLTAKVRQFLGPRLSEAIISDQKKERLEATESLLQEVERKFANEEVSKIALGGVFAQLLGESFKELVMKRGIRPDGRKFDQLRAIKAEVGVLPRPHGSALFSRGETQVLTTVTLGSVEEQQFLDTMDIEGTKRYMHHYNFPPFATGEVKPMRGPGRREIGHGALVERALAPLIPDKESFPYTIRVVSEVLASNGSSSMASACGSSLALMDAGVPLGAAVAGIACGLVTDDEGNFKILTDIAGIEDFNGEMDLKLAGTAKGFTTLQMDMKLLGVSFEVIEQALQQARAGRQALLEVMNETLGESRPTLSKFAPKVLVLKIDPEKIREVIGPGGRMINEIINESGGREVTTITIEQDGSVYITSESSELAEKAKTRIEGLVKEVAAGENYTGKVTRVVDFGAFVEILPGKEGLVHISNLTTDRNARADQVVKVGDQLEVTVAEIDSLGRINLTRPGGKLSRPQRRPPRASYPQRRPPRAS